MRTPFVVAVGFLTPCVPLLPGLAASKFNVAWRFS
jgi:hypothetical protein